MSAFVSVKNSKRIHVKKRYTSHNKTMPNQVEKSFVVNIDPTQKCKPTIIKNVAKKPETNKAIDMEEYNILHIDSIIKEKLNKRINDLPNLESELQKILISQKEHPNVQSNLVKLRRQIKDIEHTFELIYYKLRTSDILETYLELLNTEGSLSFVMTNATIKDPQEKANLVSQYISIAQEYVEIENYKRNTSFLLCPLCKGIDMVKNIDIETTFVCEDCGGTIDILDDTPSFKDSDRINMSSRYTYTRRGHFIETIKKYQGKHNVDQDVLNSIVTKMFQEMAFHSLTPQTVTKDHIYMFLSEMKLSNNYDDINLIFHVITGKQCPDFSHLEHQLLDLFEQQEKAISEVTVMNKSDNRVNSINVYYKLYKLLQKLGYPCKKSDFYILKTKTKEDEHNEKMRKAWDILGWEWIDTF